MTAPQAAGATSRASRRQLSQSASRSMVIRPGGLKSKLSLDGRLPPWLAFAKPGQGVSAWRSLANAEIRNPDRRRGADADRQYRHRHDYPQAVFEDDQAHRPRRRPVLGDALQRRRLAEPGFRAQQTRLP